MELEVLKKKLSAFRGEGGRIRGVSNDLLLEVLAAWETCTWSDDHVQMKLEVKAKIKKSFMMQF